MTLKHIDLVGISSALRDSIERYEVAEKKGTYENGNYCGSEVSVVKTSLMTTLTKIQELLDDSKNLENPSYSVVLR